MNRDALFRKAWTYQKLGLNDKALALYDQMIALDPKDWDAWVNKGSILHTDTERQEEALQCTEMQCDIRPDDVDSWINLGVMYTQFMLTDDALDAYYEALRCDPQHEGAHWNYSHALLMSGSYQEGWEQYEWGTRSIRGLRRHQHITAWEGQPLKGKTVLVWAEQGLGDTIQFSRYLKYLKYFGAKIIFEVQPELRTLFDTGKHEVMVRGDECLGSPDYQCSLMSLPYLLGTHINPHYFNPQASHEKDIVPQRAIDPKPFHRTSVVWAGRTNPPNNPLRSIPLETFLKGLPSGVTNYCSLQKDVPPHEEELLKRSVIKDERFYLKDFVDTALFIAESDRVITIDTAVAHLAGTMGVETWLLLPFEPDWRWGPSRYCTPWYQSMTLYRQTRRGDWDSVMQRVRNELEAKG